MKILFTAILALAALTALPTSVFADKCVLCGSGSTNGCQQCRLSNGVDNQANRKACESRGCKITGTGSCSTAANVKVCHAPSGSQQDVTFAWPAPAR
ncbi:MAG TPA: hypothetical protein PKE49_10200 [Leptospiraceae bacterium]|nr:hypothetical protein [Leptospirales bacterium]HMU83507.1 hypothetical protein [Leptospiraceae bacterium]HMW58873.1 hypothetical protein [Leptospiraceae bacterium]HMX56884.1 hypothetical protein [Leptospiraceae bacterium]HMY44643.1 hypothetical protein [Leptospiraceae bacterium]